MPHVQASLQMRTQIATSAAAVIPFHCVICFDEFNTTDKPPMVLPCGHTYVCLPCTKRLTRCMECRESLFMPLPENENSKINNAASAIGASQSFGARSHASAGRRYPRSSRFSPTPMISSVPSAPTAPTKPQKIPLPIPKNVVLLAMMEATEQQCRQLGAKTQKKEDQSGEATGNDTQSQSADENDDENESQTFDLDRLITGISTFTGPCGTYAVREKEGLVVLPQDPRKRKRHMNLFSGNNMSGLQNSCPDCSNRDVPGHSQNHQSQNDLILDQSPKENKSATEKIPASPEHILSLRMRKRVLEKTIAAKRENLEDFNNNNKTRKVPLASCASGHERDVKLFPAARKAKTGKSFVKRSSSALTECGNTAQQSPQMEHHQRYGDIDHSSNETCTKASSLSISSSSEGGDHSSNPTETEHSPPSSPISPSGSLSAPQEPFHIEYGQKVQVIAFEEGVATLARNQGYILASLSQLVKIGEALDESCRMEGVLDTLFQKRINFQRNLLRNAKQVQVLTQHIQIAQNNVPTHPIITEVPKSPVPATTNFHVVEETPSLLSEGDDEPEDSLDVLGLKLTQSVDPTLPFREDLDDPCTPPPITSLRPSLQTPPESAILPYNLRPTVSAAEMRSTNAPPDPSTGAQDTPESPYSIDNSYFDLARGMIVKTVHPDQRQLALNFSCGGMFLPETFQETSPPAPEDTGCANEFEEACMGTPVRNARMSAPVSPPQPMRANTYAGTSSHSPDGTDTVDFRTGLSGHNGLTLFKRNRPQHHSPNNGSVRQTSPTGSTIPSAPQRRQPQRHVRLMYSGHRGMGTTCSSSQQHQHQQQRAGISSSWGSGI